MRQIIVGNGQAGITAAKALRRHDPQAQIIIISEEPTPFYSRPGLMYYLMGRLKEWDLHIAQSDFYRDFGATLKYDKALRISPEADNLELASGESLPFDRLLLATGSKSRPLTVPGADLAGIHFMYSLQDCQQLSAQSYRGKPVLVVGGGLLGAELAEVWRSQGAQVTLLVREPWYFPKGLSELQGRIVEAEIRRQGVELYLQEEVMAFQGEGEVSKVITKSGKEFPAEAVGVTIGVDPNIELAKVSGLTTQRGILVDAQFRTSRPQVFAAGDCAEVQLPGAERTIIEQLWYSAARQGEQAARNMYQGDKPYDPGIFYNSAKFFEVDYVSIGDGRQPDDGQDEAIIISRNGRAARRFVHRGGMVTGITSVGANDSAARLLRLVEEGANLKTAQQALGGRRW